MVSTRKDHAIIIQAVPLLLRTQHNAYPVNDVSIMSEFMGVRTRPTLYQCFFTLPSVRVGKVCRVRKGANNQLSEFYQEKVDHRDEPWQSRSSCDPRRASS